MALYTRDKFVTAWVLTLCNPTPTFQILNFSYQLCHWVITIVLWKSTQPYALPKGGGSGGG